MIKLGSKEISLISVCAQQRGLRLDYMLARLREVGASKSVLLIAKAVRKIEEGGKAKTEIEMLAKEWGAWVDSFSRAHK